MGALTQGRRKWVLLAVVAVVGYLLYRRYARNLTGAQAQSQQVSSASSQGAATPSALGLTPSQSSSPDTAGGGAGNSDIVTALGGQQAALFQAIEAANQDVLSLAESQITAANNGGMGSATNQTQPVTSPQPGGSYAPTFNYYAPNLTSTPATTSLAPAAAAPRKNPTRYYTYRTSVPLGAGQTVHFTRGKGYYAA